MNLPNENTLTLFKKYFYESVLFALTGCVVYLFLAYKDLNTYIREDFIKTTVSTQVTVQENTKVLQETQKILIQLNKKEENK